MLKFIETKKNYLMALAIFFVIVSLSDTTYSLFLKSDNTESFNYNTGILDLQFIEDEQIKLDSAFPMYDSDGEKLTPYTLTIKNNGTLTYLFDLKMLSTDDENIINSKYIKVKVNDNMPDTLSNLESIIASNIIIRPNEQLTFKISIWLDIDTPNSELGKKFDAKVVSSGSAIYKTLDSSGANYPNLTEDMIPIYYDKNENTWKKADSSNTNEKYLWYDYDSSIWANTAILNESSKQIYDVTGNNNLIIDNPTINNSNLIIQEDYLDIGLQNYQYDKISSIIKIKLDEINNDNIYILTNNKISYYYDPSLKKFIFENGDVKVTSSAYILSEKMWYTLGFTYDEDTVKFYSNGLLLSSAKISSKINSSSSFKVGTNINNDKVSNLILSDIYIYNSILTEEEINNNYKNDINIIYNGLIEGYNEFTPMTVKEYYLSRPNGTAINNDDINSYYVWIPRFKYKLWNVTGESGIDSYNAYQSGIDIIFERDTSTSGTIYCENSNCYSDTLKVTPVNETDNGKYYTHPAFTTVDNELSGIWVSKYEVSTTDSNCNQTDKSNCQNTSLKLESKFGANVWSNNNLANFYQSIKKLGNEYSVIKNSEWGAIVYLSHSKYGVCQNNTCKKIEANNTYISGTNNLDSTTLNIYGVYDMAGSKAEFTMANYTTKDSEISLTNSNFQNIAISNNDYDLYYNNSFILGDATKELLLNNGIWDSNNYSYMDSINNWLSRGGIANESSPTIFNYNYTTDNASDNLTTRIIIKNS